MCSCYNIIYNSVPLSLMNSLNDIRRICVNNFRVNFTVESAEQTKKILDSLSKDNYEYLNELDYTKGHFKRGVD